MPELPEVETVRRGLEAYVLGRRIVAAEVLRDRSIRRQAGGAEDLMARLAGARVAAVVRRGKFLWLTLGDGGGAPRALLAHLGMSGQFRVEAPGLLVPGGTGGAPPPHVRVRFFLDDGSELRFVDQRTFGHVLVADLVPTDDGGPGGLGSPEPVIPDVAAHIARDVLDPMVAAGTSGRRALVARLRARRTTVKRALLDQTTLSGVGNIYADEALWRARLHHETPTGEVSPRRWTSVLDAAVEVMNRALAAGGTSFDALYVNVNGESGYFSRSLAAYGQAGQPCPRCGALIVREAFMNRSAFFCPRCQRPPRRPPLPALEGAGAVTG